MTSQTYFIAGKVAKAKGEYKEGFTVFKGSTANLKESKTAGSGIINMRHKLIKRGILKEKDSILIFTDDYAFSSPSAAVTSYLLEELTFAQNGKTKELDMDTKITNNI